MNHFRRTSSRPGVSAGTSLALLVGAVLLLAIGFVLGWGIAGELGEDEGEPDAVGLAPGAGPPAGRELAPQQIDRIAEVVADRLRAESEMENWEQAERVASIVVDTLREPARSRDLPRRPETEAAEKPPVVFDPPQLDFGTISPDTEMRGTVRISNTGDEPLKILAMRPDCQCTTVEDLSGRTIPAGESIELTAVVDSGSPQGTRRNEIRFLFEGYRAYGPMAVKLIADVAGPIRVEPPFFNLSEQVTGVVGVHARDGRPFRVLAVNGEPPVYANDFDPASSGPQSGYLLDWDMSMYDPMTCEDAEGNRMPKWWVIETDHPDAPLVDVFVRHYPCTLPEPLGDRRWLLSKQRVLLGELRPGESAEFDVELEWLGSQKPNDTIGAVRSESGQFEAELTSLDRVEDRITCRVKVTPRAEVRGLLYGEVRFFAASEADHSQPLTVIARVLPPGGSAGGERAQR
ncbi:MAG: DUF1573 domain-containing protein [Planctomycetota bacterium]|nr:DUF1573 domain-containing protein [Planctomycetota bacterium]